MFRHILTRGKEVFLSGINKTHLPEEKTVGENNLLPNGTIIALDKNQYGAKYRVFPNIYITLSTTNTGSELEITVTEDIPFDENCEASKKVWGVVQTVQITTTETLFEALEDIARRTAFSFNQKALQKLTVSQLQKVLVDATQNKN